MVSKKSRIVAAILAFFLGGFGIHKFYLGRVGQGILYLLFCWTSIPSIIAFIEFIIYLCGSEEAFDQKYNFYYIFIITNSNQKPDRGCPPHFRLLLNSAFSFPHG